MDGEDAGDGEWHVEHEEEQEDTARDPFAPEAEVPRHREHDEAGRPKVHRDAQQLRAIGGIDFFHAFYGIACPHRSRYTIAPSLSARMPASIWLRSPTTTMSKWSGSMYCRATRCTSAAVTALIRSM